VSLKPLFQNLYQLIKSIELTLEKGYITPSLILIYSGIDIVTSLNAEAGKDVTRKSFIAWSNKYLIPQLNQSLKGEDLYAARCAVLHTLTSESDMSRKGNAVQIFYTFGNQKKEGLQDVIEMVGMDHKVIKIEEFFQGFRNGLANFISEVEHDEGLQRRIFARAQRVLAYTDLKEINGFME